ncbi:MAG: SoxR reducing system RseC family protein [Spirochaetaceae bacterium]|nr:SoxR reducing system RseC family protein [Spirochaetaceae bacterium]
MRNKACVLNFEKDSVWVTPILSDTCINCNQPACEKRGKPFPAINPKAFELKCGDVVQLGVSAKAQFAQVFLALIIPILAAIGGYFLAEPVAQLFGKMVTEGMRAVGVLLCLGITTTIITIITRSKLILSKPVIINVLTNN